MCCSCLPSSCCQNGPRRKRTSSPVGLTYLASVNTNAMITMLMTLNVAGPKNLVQQIHSSRPHSGFVMSMVSLPM